MDLKSPTVPNYDGRAMSAEIFSHRCQRSPGTDIVQIVGGQQGLHQLITIVWEYPRSHSSVVLARTGIVLDAWVGSTPGSVLPDAGLHVS